MLRCKQEQKISSACIVCGDNSPAENMLRVSAELSVRTITSNSLTVPERKVNIFNKLNIYYWEVKLNANLRISLHKMWQQLWKTPEIRRCQQAGVPEMRFCGSRKEVFDILIGRKFIIDSRMLQWWLKSIATPVRRYTKSRWIRNSFTSIIVWLWKPIQCTNSRYEITCRIRRGFIQRAAQP